MNRGEKATSSRQAIGLTDKGDEAPGLVQPEFLERGRIKVDITRRQVWVRRRRVGKRMGWKRFHLLCVLLRHAGPVSREKLRDEVWEGAENGNTVDVTIGRLRGDLGFSDNAAIVSVPGGYHLVG